MEGKGHMVCVMGKAGVGKSRLISEIRDTALAPLNGGAPGTLQWMEGRCLQMCGNAAYWPFRDILRAHFGLGANGGNEALRARMHAMVRKGISAEEELAEVAPYLANILSAPPETHGWTASMQTDPPERIREKTFAAVRAFLSVLARFEPVVLVLEDLHWADRVSLDLVCALAGLTLSVPLMLVCIFRADHESRCRHVMAVGARECKDRYTEIAVGPLTSDETRRLVEALATTRRISKRDVGLVIEKAQGNPFFAEELVRSLTENPRGGDHSRRQGNAEPG